MAKFQDHQRRAAECLRLAREATDKTNKALLIEMAQTWARLAEQDKAEARTKNRNSAGSQPRPVNTIAFGAIAVCGPPRRIKSSSETPSAAHF